MFIELILFKVQIYKKFFVGNDDNKKGENKKLKMKMIMKKRLKMI